MRVCMLVCNTSRVRVSINEYVWFAIMVWGKVNENN